MQLSRNGKPYRLYRPGLPDDGRTRRGGPPVPLVRLGPEGAVLPDALYIGDRRQVAALLRAGNKARYADKDVERILRSYIAPAPAAEAAGKPGREVHVVGGDYFSQAQYKGVGRADDNIFTRFAVKIKSDGAKDDKTGSDIADRYATETLAEIFAEQGCVEEARRIYSRLILENPEKSAYFAALIDKLS